MVSLEEVLSPKPRVLRQFGILLALFSVAMGTWIFLSQGSSWKLALCIGGAGLGALGSAKPQVLKPLFVTWMLFIFPLAWLSSHVLLGMLYFGIFTPVGLLLRFRGRDVLKKVPENNQQSYWTPKQQSQDPKSYFRQF